MGGNRPKRKDCQEKAGDDDFRKGAQDSISRRTMPLIQGLGIRFRAARKHRMKPKKTPITVEKMAMFTVQHLVNIFRDVEALRHVEAPIRVIVFEAAVVIGRRQIEEGANDLYRIARHEMADEIEEVRQPVEELARVRLVREPERTDKRQPRNASRARYRDAGDC